jgi:hypothetical protein
MASHDHRLTGDIDQFVAHMDRAITSGSVTAHREGAADRRLGDARMVVRVYERYSAIGGNRLSLTIAVLGHGDQLEVSAITSGGSNALFWKINTWGEEAFLERAIKAINSYPTLAPQPPQTDA